MQVLSEVPEDYQALEIVEAALRGPPTVDSKPYSRGGDYGVLVGVSTKDGRTMDVDTFLEELRSECSTDQGLLYGVRSDQCESGDVARFIALLESIALKAAPCLARRVVESTWLISYYMLWHINNAVRIGGDTTVLWPVLRQVTDILAEAFSAVGGGRPTAASIGHERSITA